jgi:hypothetical protein
LERGTDGFRRGALDPATALVDDAHAENVDWETERDSLYVEGFGAIQGQVGTGLAQNVQGRTDRHGNEATDDHPPTQPQPPKS